MVILTVGGSPRGRAMVAAHSGALAGERRGLAGVLRGHRRRARAAIWPNSPTRSSCSPRDGGLPWRAGIATVHDSGAERALFADLAHELGVRFADLADETLATHRRHARRRPGARPTRWTCGAPARTPATLFGACLRAMVDDPAVAVTALAVDLVTEYDGDTAYADAVLDVARAHRRAAGGAGLGAVGDRRRHGATPARQRDSGAGRRPQRSWRRWVTWPAGRCRSTARSAWCSRRRNRWRARIAEGAGSAFELLADYGVPVVASRTARSLDEALAAADAIGYPVALKTAGALHKSDVGGVVLGLADEAALRVAYTAMAQSLGPAVTCRADDRRRRRGLGRLRARRRFGPLLVVAAGGTLVELLADRVVACPPVSHADALRLLDGLRIRPLLAGWRGAPAVDIDALADVIVRLLSAGDRTRRRARRGGGQSRHRLTARRGRGRRSGDPG